MRRKAYRTKMFMQRKPKYYFLGKLRTRTYIILQNIQMLLLSALGLFLILISYSEMQNLTPVNQLTEMSGRITSVYKSVNRAGRSSFTRYFFYIDQLPNEFIVDSSVSHYIDDDVFVDGADVTILFAPPSGSKYYDVYQISNGMNSFYSYDQYCSSQTAYSLIGIISGAVLIIVGISIIIYTVLRFI